MVVHVADEETQEEAEPEAADIHMLGEVVGLPAPLSAESITVRFYCLCFYFNLTYPYTYSIFLVNINSI